MTTSFPRRPSTAAPYNLLEHTLPQYGITATFVDPDEEGAFENAINDKTKAVFIETIGNPNATLIDIEKVAAIAHAHKIPLVVDSTFATPYLLRPFEYGADIVFHSATKLSSAVTARRSAALS